MTLEQIHSFLMVAKHLSFRSASELLYISQPNLSRMISSLESELNMQLFIRDSHRVRLTPAGLVFYQDCHKIYDDMKTAISRAQNVNLGLSGIVQIGILDGTNVRDFMPETLAHFKKEHPDIKIVPNNYSFSELTDGLYKGTIDLAFTLEFNLANYHNIVYEILENTPDNIVVHCSSPLYQKDQLSLADFDKQDIILISPDDLALTRNAVVKEFQKINVAPNFHFAPNLRTAILWLESGIGSAFLFSRNQASDNTSLKFFQMDSPWKTAFVIGWNKNNYNPSLPLVLEYCLKRFQSYPKA